MRYEVEIGGRIRQVHVRRADGRFVVGIDGRELTVDAVLVDPHTLSLLVGTSSYEVTIASDRTAGLLNVRVGAVPVVVALNGARRAKGTDDSGHGTGPERVVAPMPGKIVRVLVGPGDSVRPRQPLVVIEAMKMENELRASRAGVVAEVLVQERQSVDAGALLLVVAAA